MGDAAWPGSTRCCHPDQGHHTNHGFAWERGQKTEENGQFKTVFLTLHVPLQKNFILKGLGSDCANKSKRSPSSEHNCCCPTINMKSQRSFDASLRDGHLIYSPSTGLPSPLGCSEVIKERGGERQAVVEGLVISYSPKNDPSQAGSPSTPGGQHLEQQAPLGLDASEMPNLVPLARSG